MTESCRKCQRRWSDTADWAFCTATPGMGACWLHLSNFLSFLKAGQGRMPVLSASPSKNNTSTLPTCNVVKNWEVSKYVLNFYFPFIFWINQFMPIISHLESKNTLTLQRAKDNPLDYDHCIFSGGVTPGFLFEDSSKFCWAVQISRNSQKSPSWSSQMFKNTWRFVSLAAASFK